MEKINILYFTGSFINAGAEKYIKQLIENIDRRKFNVCIGCMVKSGHYLARIEKTDANIVEFKLKGSLFNLHGVKQLFHLVSFMRSNNIQLVHTAHFETNLYVGLAAKFARTPVLIVSRRNTGNFMVRKHFISEKLYTSFAYAIIVDAKK